MACDGDHRSRLLPDAVAATVRTPQRHTRDARERPDHAAARKRARGGCIDRCMHVIVTSPASTPLAGAHPPRLRPPAP
ncbi:hypothetical protein CKY51_08280 [Xanthomonas maliensis]|nr:hypothetical protein CKY51_08280 [Xanthomonas maliensis]